MEENNVAAGTGNVARCSGDAMCRLQHMRPQFLIFLLYPLKIVIPFEGDDSLMMLWRESMLENMSPINTCNDEHSNVDDDDI